MKTKATFNIVGSFNLTGRGLVIYGNIIEGTVIPGLKAPKITMQLSS